MPDLWKYPWPEIAAYYEAGHSRLECQRRFGFSQAAWTRAIRSGRLAVPLERTRPERQPHACRGNPIYDWAEVQRYHDAGNGLRACQRKFGFTTMTWYKAVARGVLQPRQMRIRPVEEILRSPCRTTVKKNLLKLGILENRCDECGLTEWRGKRLAIQIDHRNGVRDDNRLENLRMLCPNCHSQTDTFAARNWKVQRERISFLIIERTIPGRQAVRQGPLKPPFGGSNPSPGAWPYRLEA